MNYNFTIITLELGIPVIATIIALVGIILYAYIYFQLYEETQAIILSIGFLSFIFSALEAANIIISLSNPNSEISLNLYKFEQIALSITIIPWLIYIKNKLKLTEYYHSVLEKLYIAAVFLLILISAVALLYPQLFISTKDPMTTLNETMRQSIKSRGELGAAYIFRDFVFTVYCFIIICSFIYEMSVNKLIKGNISGLVLISLIFIAFVDDFNGISVYSQYSSNFLTFPNWTFSRITLVYAVFNIVMIYSSVSRFISAIHKKSTQYYDLESIKAQDSIIINTAINTSEKLSELKSSFRESVNSLVSKVENTYSTINNFKNDINKIIDYTNEFITIESFQINDGNTNLEKIDELINTYPNLQMSVELQKKTLEESNEKLQESIEKIYSLQSQSKIIIDLFEDFQSKLDAEKLNFSKELGKSESFNQLSFQINRIISFMTNMSDKTKTLAINSDEWHNNFSVVSKEVSELVTETAQATNRMQNLLFKIEDIFKKFNYSRNSINNNVYGLIEEISGYYDKLNKFNKGMEKQNDYNMNIIKSTDKMYSSISNMTNIIINEENDFVNIKNKIEEINNYIQNISEKAYMQNSEVKNLMRDMNKLLATSDDLESVTNKLNEEIMKFLEYTDDLESKVDEYSKVI